MYEVEVRALVTDFILTKKRLDLMSQKISSPEKESNIFFYNPNQDDFDLRLRLRADKTQLSFKEAAGKSARREIETTVNDPLAFYELLLATGFKIRKIGVKLKYVYQMRDYEITLMNLVDWGNLIEVEKMIGDEKNGSQIELEIKNFMMSELKVNDFLSTTEMNRIDAEYSERIDFYLVSINDLVNYVTEKADFAGFPKK